MRVPDVPPPVDKLQPLVNRAVAEVGAAKFSTSCGYLVRDVLYLAAVLLLTRAAVELGVSTWLIYPIYSIVAGTVATGLWVLGHECGHGAFGSSPLQNDSVGFVLHSLLLVPYFSWQFTHAKHHRHTNHLHHGETHVPKTLEGKALDAAVHSALGEGPFAVFNIVTTLLFGWPVYLLTNASGGSLQHDHASKISPKLAADHFRPWSQIFPPKMQGRVAASALGCVAALLALGWAGGRAAFFWYAGPYLVVNAWLVGYTWLQHTHKEIPHYGQEVPFLQGALCTVDRPYPWLIDHLHHHIGTTHVAHHISSRVPHYKAGALTQKLALVLGDYYLYDPTPVWTALWEAASCCHYIGDTEGTQKYRSFGSADRKRA